MHISNMPDNTPVFKALAKGVLFGFVFFFLFVLMSFLFGSLVPTSTTTTAYTFLTSPLDMGILGFFIGLGIEVYPVLV